MLTVVRIIIIFLFTLHLPAYAQSNDLPIEFSFENSNIRITDTFDLRAKYSGKAIRLTAADTQEKSQNIFASKEFNVVAIRGESEDVLISINTENSGYTITDLSTDQPQLIATNSELPIPDIFIIGDLYELKNNEIQNNSYPDPLIPLAIVEKPLISKGGLRIAVTIRIPRNAKPGIYKSSIRITSGSGRIFSIPFNINVLDILMPLTSRVATQYFDIDERSIGYQYQLNPKSNELSTILTDAEKLLALHRFSPATSRNNSRIGNNQLKNTFSEAGTDWTFKPGVISEYTGPKFDELGAAFKIEFSLATLSNRKEYLVFSHRWHTRDAGYSVSVINGNLRFTAGISINSKNKNKNSIVESIEAPILFNGSSNRISVSVTPSQWTLSVNNNQSVRLPVSGPITPAWGGWITLGSKISNFEISELKWITESGDTTTIKRSSKEPYEEKSLKTPNNILFYPHTNDLRLPEERSTAKLLKNLSKIKSQEIMNGSFVSLPFDEIYTGSRADRNIQFAKEFRAAENRVPILHTFGSLRSQKSNANKRLSLLRSFSPYIDIFSIRPSVYFEQRNFFDNNNRDISMYIHDVNIVEKDDALLLGRNFFWKLDELDIDMTTFWNTNLWFQPEKANRPARRIVDAPNGFAVTKRNPSGLGSGMIFYPGPTSLLSSLRARAWRDGLEDSEILLMLRQHITKFENKGVLTKEEIAQLNQGLELLSKHESLLAKDNSFKKAPRNRGKSLRNMRTTISKYLAHQQ